MIIESYARQVLYDVEWQCLRVQLLGFWGERGTVEMALDKVIAYTQGVPRGLKVWRGLNLLNAVLLSYRGGVIHPCWRPVVKVRDVFTREHDLHPLEMGLGGEYNPWSWDRVIVDLRGAKEIDLIWIMRNLKGRVRAAQRKAKRSNEGYDPQLMKTRPELMKFLTLVVNEIGLRREHVDRKQAVPG